MASNKKSPEKQKGLIDMNKINYRSLVFFDLETSGLDFNKHEIIQLAAIDGETGDVFNEKLDFDLDKADPEALEMNGFDVDIWNEEAISQEEACRKFSKFLREHSHLDCRSEKTGKTYKVAALAGYNILTFDKFFLSNLFQSFGVFLPADYRMYDIYQMALWKWPNLERYKLEALCSEKGIEVGKFHDAIEDVKATIEIAKLLVSEPLKFQRTKWGAK